MDRESLADNFANQCATIQLTNLAQHVKDSILCSHPQFIAKEPSMSMSSSTRGCIYSVTMERALRTSSTSRSAPCPSRQSNRQLWAFFNREDLMTIVMAFGSADAA